MSDDMENHVAVVLTLGNKACVLHPDGDRHPNAVATVKRLKARGFVVVPVPDDVWAWLVCLRGDARAYAERLLRRLTRKEAA